MTKLHELAELGQSIWLDYIRRDLLDSGGLSQLRESGVRGVTSNPSIFAKAIAESDDYDDALRVLAFSKSDPKKIYESLAIEDIRRAADEFATLYHDTDRRDGYVSLEADPRLAFDTEGTIAEARRLFAAVDRPNVYIKVPATPQGIPAIRTLIGEGINVNVTLIFSIGVYEEVAEAFIAGLEDLEANGGDPRQVSSVASFFVSRIDTKVDNALDEIGESDIRGAIGIASAKLAYQRFLEIFSGPRWQRLQEKGALVQRPLWGSTSTKDPAYPDTMYVDNLIGPHTVNTIPPETLEAYMDHGTVALTLQKHVELARAQIARLAELGISLDEVTDELLDEGVTKFADPFVHLLDTIGTRRDEILGEGNALQADLGEAEPQVEQAVARIQAEDVIERLWDHDYTLWAGDPTEITNRLDWLSVAADMLGELPALDQLARTLSAEGYTHALLLGMGGSSLAPDLFARTFGTAPNHLALGVLDSTDPGTVSAFREQLDPAHTLFIVSSKSGGTAETLAFFNYFYTWAASALGADAAGEHFIAITDPGSKLTRLSNEFNFRRLFLNNPNIGGRYSALSHFGMVPAALMGVDVSRLLQSATTIARPADAGEAAWLGAALGTYAQHGRDKLTFIISPEIAAFGDWVEQLIAESTGKSGKGILPVVGEPPSTPSAYSDDRLFVYIKLKDGTSYDEQVALIRDAGQPVIRVDVADRYELGRQFLIWEIATAVAGHLLGIHPFNQPNVESAKVRAREMIDSFRESGSLNEGPPRITGGGIDVYEIDFPADSPQQALDNFLGNVRAGDYIAVHAYVQPTPATDAALLNFRTYLRAKSGVVVTTGYGPRFLHSTGQLHKGDAGNGHFIQIVSDPLRDLPIPDTPGQQKSTMTFGVLKRAQAIGDGQALRDAGRRVIRFVLHGDVAVQLADLQA